LPRILIKPWIGALGLFLFLFGASLFFFRGTLEVSDEQFMALTTQTIAEDLSLTFDRELYGKQHSNYGIGTSLTGAPFYLLEKLLASTFIMEDVEATLIPLANTALLGLIGVLLGSLMSGQRRWGYLALIILASPLFSLSVRFYSEFLSTAGLAGLAAALFHGVEPGGARREKLLITGAFLAALAAMLARVAMLPFLGIVLFWGWRLGARKPVIAAGLTGVVAGVAETLLQNWTLRGSLFATGYEGQTFTTPLLTGLYGLLAAPERGILIFFPAAAVVLAGWKHLGGRMRAVLALACGLTLFSLVFHGRFWTWHGGWTTGPRFLLPSLAFFIPPVTELFAKRQSVSPGLRLALILALIWSALLSFIYVRYSAFLWWNQLWGFHQIENQWLFFPQMSLWQTWFDGVPLPTAQPDFPLSFRMVVLGTSLALVVVSLYPLMLPFRGFLGTDPKLSFLQRLDQIDKMFLAGLLILAGFFGIHHLAGPRGWQASGLDELPRGEKSHLLVEEPGIYEGWLDYPLRGTLRLAFKANALYQIYFDERLIAEQLEPMGQHIDRREIEVTPGYHKIRVRILPRNPETPPLFQMYWTWGGEGRYLAPAGGEYVHPQPLSPFERFFTLIWRRKFLLLALALALLLLYQSLPARPSGESAA